MTEIFSSNTRNNWPGHRNNIFHRLSYANTVRHHVTFTYAFESVPLSVCVGRNRLILHNINGKFENIRGLWQQPSNERMKRGRPTELFSQPFLVKKMNKMFVWFTIHSFSYRRATISKFCIYLVFCLIRIPRADIGIPNLSILTEILAIPTLTELL